MKRLKLFNFTLLIFLFSLLVYGEELNFLVTYKKARVYAEPYAFSKQITLLPFGTVIKVKNKTKNWIKIYIHNHHYFIHIDALIDNKGFQRQTNAVKKRKLKLTHAAKKFSEEDEIITSAKGFNKQVEREYKKKHSDLKYHLVDMFEKKGEIFNIQKKYLKWRYEGELGEFGYFYKNIKLGKNNE